MTTKQAVQLPLPPPFPQNIRVSGVTIELVEKVDTCWSCDGSGKNPYDERSCPTCGGSGQVTYQTSKL